MDNKNNEDAKWLWETKVVAANTKTTFRPMSNNAIVFCANAHLQGRWEYDGKDYGAGDDTQPRRQF